jgi:hypothetical protein
MVGYLFKIKPTSVNCPPSPPRVLCHMLILPYGRVGGGSSLDSLSVFCYTILSGDGGRLGEQAHFSPLGEIAHPSSL